MDENRFGSKWFLEACIDLENDRKIGDIELPIRDECTDEVMPDVRVLRAIHHDQPIAKYGIEECLQLKDNIPGKLADKLISSSQVDLTALAGVVLANQKTEMEKMESELDDMLELTYNLERQIQKFRHKLDRIKTFVTLD